MGVLRYFPFCFCAGPGCTPAGPWVAREVPRARAGAGAGFRSCSPGLGTLVQAAATPLHAVWGFVPGCVHFAVVQTGGQ